MVDIYPTYPSTYKNIHLSFPFQAMTIALSSDFIPHMVYKWMKSPTGNLQGYIRWSVTGELV